MTNELVVDWSQFWPGMISTFVGFVLALMGQWLWEQHKSRAEERALLARFAEELRKVSETLERYTEGMLDLKFIKIPVWDEAQNAGKISLISSSIRSDLFVIYNSIQEFNSWCAVNTNYYFENGHPHAQLNDRLNKQKNTLLGVEGTKEMSITEMLNRLSRKMKK